MNLNTEDVIVYQSDGVPINPPPLSDKVKARLRKAIANREALVRRVETRARHDAAEHQDVAARVSKRLLEARYAQNPFASRPKDEIQMMDLVDSLAKHPRKLGVRLLPYELRKLRVFHTMRRAVIADELKAIEDEEKKEAEAALSVCGDECCKACESMDKKTEGL